MSWENLRIQLQNNFETFSREGILFNRSLDRDRIWQVYLDSFPQLTRQEHNCNACKAFLRQYAGIVAVRNNSFVSIWDDIDCIEYKDTLEALKAYLKTCPVENVWVTDQAIMGNNSSAGFTHLVIKLDKRSPFIKRSNEIPTFLGDKRTNYQVLYRGLSEITLDSLDTVLELIDSNSIYRGSEHKASVSKFRSLKVKYDSLNEDQKIAFVWSLLGSDSYSLCLFRNTVIGTLLVDISEGKDLEAAVKSYEFKVAPSNYKRPSAVATPKMIDNAKKHLEDEGLMPLLSRRPATGADLDINKILYKSSPLIGKDVFAEMKEEALVNPSKLPKTDISIEDFITQVIPSSGKIEILPLNSQQGNFVTLLTSYDFNIHSDNPTLFKWNNPFSWSYTENMADSIKQNVVKAGGSIVGDLRISLQWNESGNNIVDFDLHCYEHNIDDHIFYSKNRGINSHSFSGGNLDVDMISPRSIGIENIVYSSIKHMKATTYEIKVHNYSNFTSKEGFTVEIEIQGQSYFISCGPLKGREYKSIAIIEKQGDKLILKSKLEESKVKSLLKWEVSTNVFTEVSYICKSPNYWDNEIGNKHYFFFMPICKSNETHKIFYNEFLHPNLDKYRKVFEILSSKLSIPYNSSLPQLSGLGFSSTLNSYIILRVSDKQGKKSIYNVKVK